MGRVCLQCFSSANQIFQLNKLKPLFALTMHGSSCLWRNNGLISFHRAFPRFGRSGFGAEIRQRNALRGKRKAHNQQQEGNQSNHIFVAGSTQKYNLRHFFLAPPLKPPRGFKGRHEYCRVLYDDTEVAGHMADCPRSFVLIRTASATPHT